MVRPRKGEFQQTGRSFLEAVENCLWASCRGAGFVAIDLELGPLF
jgi:hypothetical protein